MNFKVLYWLVVQERWSGCEPHPTNSPQDYFFKATPEDAASIYPASRFWSTTRILGHIAWQRSSGRHMLPQVSWAAFCWNCILCNQGHRANQRLGDKVDESGDWPHVTAMTLNSTIIAHCAHFLITDCCCVMTRWKSTWNLSTSNTFWRTLTTTQSAIFKNRSGRSRTGSVTL